VDIWIEAGWTALIWRRRLTLPSGGEVAAHDRGLFGHGDPQDVTRRLCGIRRLDGCLGNERYRKQQAAQP
jgi:hypothetical protein